MNTKAIDRSKAGVGWFGLRMNLAILVVLFGTGMAFGAEPVAPDDGKTVLIHTDAGDVTVGDVRANLAAVPPLNRVTLLHDQAQLSNMVRLVAAQKLILKEATEKGWDQKPEVASAVTAAEERARTDVILRDYLGDQTRLSKDYPSEAEIQAAYDANSAVFAVPKQYHYAQILVALPKATDKATEDKAAAKLADIESKLKASGADFGVIAAASSDDVRTAKRQGDVGTVAEAQVPAAFKGALTALRPGAVSEPIQTDTGWYILKVLDVSEARQRPLDEVREQLRTGLRNQRAQQDAKARIDAFVEKTPVPSPEALAKLTSTSAQ